MHASVLFLLDVSLQFHLPLNTLSISLPARNRNVSDQDATYHLYELYSCSLSFESSILNPTPKGQHLLVQFSPVNAPLFDGDTPYQYPW